MYTGLVPVLALALAGGCAKKGGGTADSCEKVGAHFAQLAHDKTTALPDSDPNKKAAMAELAVLPKARASLIKECQDNKWSGEVRRCFLDSKTAEEFKTKCAALIERVSKGKTPAAASKPVEGAPPAAAPATDSEKTPTAPTTDPKATAPAPGTAPNPTPAANTRAPQGGEN